MKNLLVADLLLLRRKVILLIVALFGLVAGFNSWITRDSAASQLDVIRQGLLANGINPDLAPCRLTDMQFDLATCQQLAINSAEGYQLQSLLGYVPHVREAAELTSLAGAVGFSAHLSASMIGFIVLALIAALHIGTEWEGRTAAPLLAAISAWRMLLVKTVSISLVGVAVIIIGSVGVLLGNVIPTDIALPEVHAGISTYALQQAGLAVAVLTLMALIILGVTFLLRGIVSSFAVAVFFLAMCYLTGFSSILKDVFPGGWISTIMNFSDDSYRRVLDTIWPAANPEASLSVAIVGLITVALGIWLIGAWTLARRRPLA